MLHGIQRSSQHLRNISIIPTCFPFQRLIDGFAHIVIHPHSQTFFFSTLHGIGSHRNDRQINQFGILAYKTSGFKTTHLRHLSIHQHEIITRLVDHFDREAFVNGMIFHQQYQVDRLSYGLQCFVFGVMTDRTLTVQRESL